MSTEPIHRPAVLSVKLEAKTKADEAALLAALEKFARADPSVSISVDRESGELILGGTNELDLDRVVANLISQAIKFNVGAPQVAYLETLAGAVEIDHTHAVRRGNVWLKMKLEPNEAHAGNTFEIARAPITVGQREAITNGVRSMWESGVLIGFPMVDTKVTLLDAHAGDNDTPEPVYEAAARATLKIGCQKAGVNILEPIMRLVIVAPSEFTGVIAADLSGRRTQIVSTTRTGPQTQIIAQAPLAALFGFASSLLDLTAGQASHRLAYSHYQVVPRNVSPDPGPFPPAVGMRA